MRDSTGTLIFDPRQHLDLSVRSGALHGIPPSTKPAPMPRTEIERRLVESKSVKEAFGEFAEARREFEQLFDSVKPNLNASLRIADAFRSIKSAKTPEAIGEAARSATIDRTMLDASAARARGMLVEFVQARMIPAAKRLIKVGREALADIRKQAMKAESTLAAWGAEERPLQGLCDQCEGKLNTLAGHVNDCLAPRIRGLRTWHPSRNVLHAIDSFFSIE